MDNQVKWWNRRDSGVAKTLQELKDMYKDDLRRVIIHLSSELVIKEDETCDVDVGSFFIYIKISNGENYVLMAESPLSEMSFLLICKLLKNPKCIEIDDDVRKMIYRKLKIIY